MARRRYNSSKHFRSHARVVHLKQFREGRAVYTKSNGKIEDGWEWVREPGFWPEMPVILNGSGIPWDLGNTYLLCHLNKSFRTKMASIDDRAKSLCFYLKFIEDEGLDYLDFPAQTRRRPTYLFRYKLQELIDLGMAPSTARKHIGHVISFYRGILYYNLVDENRIGNKPFRSFKRSIQTINNVGLLRFKDVQSTDISIRVTKPGTRIDRILDGGELRPLSKNDQQSIFWGFERRYCTVETELIMLTMLNTGARIQSACTLRVGHIQDAYNELKSSGKNWVLIHSNKSRYPIDTKFGKTNIFIFPKTIVEKLFVYINSDVHKKRMKASFFGLSDENYAFLTEQYNPFYTSRSEIIKRQDEDAHWETNATDFKPQNGATVRANIRNLITRIRKVKPEFEDFSPHDLRATFGMNIVRRLANDPKNSFTTTQMELAVKTALNHNDISTSRRYVNFDETLINAKSINAMHEALILDGYKIVENIYGGNDA